MHRLRLFGISLVIGLAWCGVSLGQHNADKIVHDSEYYILETQNGKVWAVEDRELDRKLAELRQKYGMPATMALSKPPADMKNLPFDPLEFIKHLGELPFDPASEPGPGQ